MLKIAIYLLPVGGIADTCGQTRSIKKSKNELFEKSRSTLFAEGFMITSQGKKGYHRKLHVVITAVAVLFVFLLILWAGVFYGSMQDYKTGEKLLKEGETIRAITYFDRSLHWYAPLNPYVERSARRLWEIGERAEQDKDTRLALIAYESIRNAFYGASHVFTPGKDWIQRAESKIHALSALQGTAETPSLKKDPMPHGLWSGLVVIAFLGWIGSLVALIMTTFRQEEVRGGRRLFWLGFSFLCFILWLVGMAKA